MCPGPPGSAGTRIGKTKKVKTNLDLLEQETVSVSGICWAICKSAPHADNHTNIPPLSFFYRPDALPDAQPTASKHWRQRLTKYSSYINLLYIHWPYALFSLSSKLFFWLIFSILHSVLIQIFVAVKNILHLQMPGVNCVAALVAD